MGALQLAIAAAFDVVSLLIAIPLVLGSWTNAKIFLLLSLTDDAANAWSCFRPLSYLSFALLTIAYGLLVCLAVYRVM